MQKNLNTPAMASKSRVNYNNAVTQANQILQLIESDASWGQFKGESYQSVKEALEAVTQGAAKAPFNARFILDQGGSMRKKMDTQEFELCCKQFSIHLDESIGKLQKATNKIVKQHQAGMGVERE